MEQNYYYSKIKEENRKFYSLNFLYAKLYDNKEQKGSSKIKKKEVEEYSESHQNTKFIPARFYKNISTII